MNDASVFFALLAGLVSFLSPCCLPLIPGYISFISGVSVTHFEHASRDEMKRILISSGLFVSGFTIVFVALGASASAVGHFLRTPEIFRIVETVSGIFIILSGVFLMGYLKIPFLYSEHRLQISNKKFGLWGSMPLGMAFAVGWTPCLGPILASILYLASASHTVAMGSALLLVYSLGLGIPFILTALLVSRSLRLTRTLNRYGKVISIFSGMLLIAMGVLLVTHKFAYLNVTLQKLLPDWLRFSL